MVKIKGCIFGTLTTDRSIGVDRLIQVLTVLKMDANVSWILSSFCSQNSLDLNFTRQPLNESSSKEM